MISQDSIRQVLAEYEPSEFDLPGFLNDLATWQLEPGLSDETVLVLDTVFDIFVDNINTN